MAKITALASVQEKIKSGTLIQDGGNFVKNRFHRWVTHMNLLHFFNLERLLTKAYLKQFPVIGKHHIAVGNYYLDTRIPLNSKSVIYSMGILTDVSFDQAITQKFQCPVFMYDPTPRCVEFMKQYADYTLFHFFPIGVWTENTELEFTFPVSGGSASAVMDGKRAGSFTAICKDMQTLMQENQHSHIDVLKMDIEGAALPITEYLIERKLYPKQLIVEFERPKNDLKKNIDFFYRVMRCVEYFQSTGYEIFQLPRKKAKFFSLELLFVKVG